MTVVVAAHDGAGRSVIASDTLVTTADARHGTAAKIVSGHRRAVGVAGELRSVNLIQRDRNSWLEQPNDVFDFVDSARRLFRDDGYEPQSSEGAGGALAHGQEMLYVTPGGVSTIGGAWGVTHVESDTVVAIGSGAHFALGAAFASSHLPIEDRVLMAVAAATLYDLHCGGEPELVVVE